MKRNLTPRLISATATMSVAAMSAVVLSTVLPATFAVAQPSPAPTPEKAASSAAATAKPNTPAPAKTAEPAKAATSAKAATQAPAAKAASNADTSSSIEEMVKQANSEVFQAVVERDANLYDQRVADDAVLLGFGTGIVSKFKGYSNNAPAGTKIEAFRVNNMRVKLEGNTAVVVGRYWVKTSRSGQIAQVTLDFMNVLAKRDNRWQLIAGHLEDANS